MNEELVLPANIHLPADSSWWPLAPGWWLLLITSCLIVLLVWHFIRLKQAKTNLIIPQALQQLAWLEQQPKLSDPQLIRELSSLLRRTAMSLYGRKKIAGLTGQKWLQFLDNQSDKQLFTQGIGNAFLHQPYQKNSTYNRTRLIKLVKYWINLQEKVNV